MPISETWLDVTIAMTQPVTPPLAPVIVTTPEEIQALQTLHTSQEYERQAQEQSRQMKSIQVEVLSRPEIIQEEQKIGTYLIDVIKSAKIISVSAVSAHSIQCRVRAADKIRRVSSTDHYMRKVALSGIERELDTVHNNGIIADLFCINIGGTSSILNIKGAYASVIKLAEIEAQKLWASEPRQHKNVQFLFYFDDRFFDSPGYLAIRDTVVKDLCRDILTRMLAVFQTGHHKTKAQEQKLRMRIKKLREAMGEAFEAGIGDDELEAMIRDCKVKSVHST